VNMGRGLEHFAEGLSAVYGRMATALKPGAPLSFTYHHNSIDAYLPIAVAILDAGLTCSASFPCPAEMSASIHINATSSSIVDTVFICRSTGTVPKKWVVDTAEGVARLVNEDIEMLLPAYRPTHGDIRCIVFGHLTRLAVWHLRSSWDRKVPVMRRVAAVAAWTSELGGEDAVLRCLNGASDGMPLLDGVGARENAANYGEGETLVSF